MTDGDPLTVLRDDVPAWVETMTRLRADEEAHHIETDRAAYAILARLVADDPQHPLAEQARAVLAEEGEHRPGWWYA